MRKAKKTSRLTENQRARSAPANHSKRNLRESIYQREWLKYGMVPCYVCRQHVKKMEATLEHILPIALFGTDHPKNLAISHGPCNNRRGVMPVAHVVKAKTTAA